ncbi:hypothetical protein BJI69_01345 [Luteibacter rhizovicinus DSM 16549]|uniref:Uncharacterized protein n=1 Tax=Luteibacter rhizovicinus DSM 16549 TaxID=1440763 RepID=A0A1L3ENT3_9GAMM|nr:hypothetical protein [Luteibacter rhizovicinus]APG02684.1 hypothetical protein BJI69_01345 [Luteibacter rhizovicinus DSM 16549]KLD77843.1 hypothetical protein Y886_13385 [Xanthomonas hyacinthi DSM 19077]
MNPLDTGPIVTCTLEPDAQPTAEQIAELAALEDRPIDYSDIPETPPDALWMRLGPGGHFLGRLMAEARERELAGGPFDHIERLLPALIARVAAMEDNCINLSDMPEMAPYALTLITGDGPSLEALMPEARELAFATA